jgi:hypothetical protein
MIERRLDTYVFFDEARDYFAQFPKPEKNCSE